MLSTAEIADFPLRPPQPPPCKMCGQRTVLFDAVDFNKFCSSRPLSFGTSGRSVTYFICTACDCLFTDHFDSWTPADFARRIYNADYVKVDPEYVGSRAERTASEIADMLRGLEHKRILDYGSGTGVFARHMHDRGFSVECYDPFSSPTKPVGAFDIVTAFEVVEHSPSPTNTFAEMQRFLGDNGCIIFGQTMLPPEIMLLRGSWWYLAPRNGHVTTYSNRTFVRYAERSGLDFFSTPGTYGLCRSQSEGRDVLSRFGKLLKPLRLVADADSDCFHGPELDDRGQEFRWTRRDTIYWRHDGAPGHYVLELPFFIENEDGFSASSRLWVDDREVSTSALPNAITAEAELHVGSDIKLVTPPCKTPRQIRGDADDRRLGLAVLAA